VKDLTAGGLFPSAIRRSFILGTRYDAVRYVIGRRALGQGGRMLERQSAPASDPEQPGPPMNLQCYAAKDTLVAFGV